MEVKKAEKQYKDKEKLEAKRDRVQRR